MRGSLRDRFAFWLERYVNVECSLLFAYEGENYLGRACYRNRINGHVVVR